jgi:hypothetical protein
MHGKKQNAETTNYRPHLITPFEIFSFLELSSQPDSANKKGLRA